MGGRRRASIKALAIIAVLAAAVGISPAAAADIAVWPDQVIPTSANGFVSYATKFYTTNAGGNYYAPLELPVGATITRLTLYRSTFSGAAQTLVALTRMKIGQAGENLAMVDITEANNAITPHSTASVTTPAVEAGYRYFLMFYTYNTTGTGVIHGAKVRYNLP